MSRFLFKKGIRNSIFIDDGRLLAKSASEAEANRVAAYAAIARAGWSIEKNKSDQEFEASRDKTYLGFIIDTQKMWVKAPRQKINGVS